VSAKFKHVCRRGSILFVDLGFVKWVAFHNNLLGVVLGIHLLFLLWLLLSVWRLSFVQLKVVQFYLPDIRTWHCRLPVFFLCLSTAIIGTQLKLITPHRESRFLATISDHVWYPDHFSASTVPHHKILLQLCIVLCIVPWGQVAGVHRFLRVSFIQLGLPPWYATVVVRVVSFGALVPWVAEKVVDLLVVPYFTVSRDRSRLVAHQAITLIAPEYFAGIYHLLLLNLLLISLSWLLVKYHHCWLVALGLSFGIYVKIAPLTSRVAVSWGWSFTVLVRNGELLLLTVWSGCPLAS